MVVLLLSFALRPFPAVLAAHDLSLIDTRVVFTADGRYSVEMVCDLDALMLGLGPGHESQQVAAYITALSPAERDAGVSRLERLFERRVRNRFDGEPARFAVSLPDATRSTLGTVARLDGEIPEAASSYTFFASRSFRQIRLSVGWEGSEDRYELLLPAGEESAPFSLVDGPPKIPTWSVARNYVVLGFEHILPLGVDHILFVLGLFLLSPHWRQLLWQVTAFTVAHTLTLGLSATGQLELPATIVEPLIALSIAAVAIENLVTDELKSRRLLVVFVFGLLHGLGFAGVLGELGLPRGRLLVGLVSFNVGVEIGQLAVLLVAALLLGPFRERRWYRSRLVLPASAALASCGLWWFIDRLI